MRLAAWCLAAILAQGGLSLCTDALSQSANLLGYDPLTSDDYVFRGSVDRVENVSVPAKEWYPPSMLQPGMSPVNLVKITFRISKKLRGQAGGPQVVLVYGRPENPRDELVLNEYLAPGADVIATALYRSEKKCFVAGLVLIKKDEKWWSVRGSAPDLPLSEQALYDRVERVSVPSLTRASELVIRGRIKDRHESGPDGDEQETYTVSIQERLKGSAPDEVVLKCNRRLSADPASTSTFIPFILEPGTDWYLFLQKAGNEYTVIAGPRALLRIDGDLLYENMKVPSLLNSRDLRQQVARFASQ
jgi:hypothetical protein